MTSSRDDATLRRYREASAAADERPSDATRAAILAAAAREVNARPVSTDAPRPVARRRWPLAVAATVLLSTLAALVATHTEQEMPTFNAPADRIEEKVAVAPAQHAQLEAPSAAAPAASADSAASDKNVAPAAPPVAQPPAAPPAKTANGRFAAEPPMADSSTAGVGNKLSKTAPAAERESSVRSVEEARSRSDAPQPAAEPAARAKANVANEGDARGDEAQSAEPKRRAFPGAASGSLQSAPNAPPPPAAPAATTTPPPVAGAAATAQSPAAGRDLEAATDRLKREQAYGERAAARRDAAPAPVLQGATRQEAAPKESTPKDYEASADAWLDTIMRLRREGRHDEADAELKRLRERFPDVRVPPAALRPTGTR